METESDKFRNSNTFVPAIDWFLWALILPSSIFVSTIKNLASEWKICIQTFWLSNFKTAPNRFWNIFASIFFWKSFDVNEMRRMKKFQVRIWHQNLSVGGPNKKGMQKGGHHFRMLVPTICTMIRSSGGCFRGQICIFWSSHCVNSNIIGCPPFAPPFSSFHFLKNLQPQIFPESKIKFVRPLDRNIKGCEF